jgi:hypothetical protein
MSYALEDWDCNENGTAMNVNGGCKYAMRRWTKEKGLGAFKHKGRIT